MYIPTKYEEKDWEQVEYLIEKYPLGTVITHSEEGIIVSHLPFYLKTDESTGRKYLEAHIARKNHQLPVLQANSPVCVVFQSVSTYISPSYYPSKKETHKFVPTWDFAASHIYGTPTVTNDYDFVRNQVNTLTDINEASRDDKWKVSDAPENYTNLLQKGISGLSIEIERWECKYKFDQEMKEQDIQGVICGLNQDGKKDVADFVQPASDRLCERKKAAKREKENS